MLVLGITALCAVVLARIATLYGLKTMALLFLGLAVAGAFLFVAGVYLAKLIEYAGRC